MKQTILSNCRIIGKDKDFNGSVVIEGNKITDIKKDKIFHPELILIIHY